MVENNKALLELLSSSAVSDDICAASYENTAPRCRAALKTAIALACFHFGRQAAIHQEAKQDMLLGFIEESRAYPYEEAYIFVPSNYPAPALLCAGAMLPALADVQNINCIFIGDGPSSSLLVALELCGIENKYRCSMERARDVLNLMGGSQSIAFLLHDDSLGFLAKICAENNQTFINESALPKIICLCQESRDIVEFAYGSESLINADDSRADLVVVAAGDHKICPARLVLEAGCECFWLFENLTPQTFKVKRRFFGQTRQAKEE